VIAPILAHDERQAQQDVARYALLAARDPAFRAALQAAERRLAVVGLMRLLYADLRAAKQRAAVCHGGTSGQRESCHSGAAMASATEPASPSAPDREGTAVERDPLRHTLCGGRVGIMAADAHPRAADVLGTLTMQTYVRTRAEPLAAGVAGEEVEHRSWDAAAAAVRAAVVTWLRRAIDDGDACARGA
jgi:hypothetical protein